MEARNRIDDLYSARTLADIFRFLKHEVGRPDCNFLSSSKIIFTQAMKTQDKMHIATNKDIGTIKSKMSQKHIKMKI